MNEEVRKVGHGQNKRHREALLEELAEVFRRFVFVNDIDFIEREKVLSSICLTAIESFLKTVRQFNWRTAVQADDLEKFHKRWKDALPKGR